MAKYSTDNLLKLCRLGVTTKNQNATDAGHEVYSYLVFNSLLEEFVVLPSELEKRLDVLFEAQSSMAEGSLAEKFPVDIVEEEEQEDSPFISVEPQDEPPDEPGPLVA